MIEENENIDLVTMRRQQDQQQSQVTYRQAVSEGRLAVRSQPASPPPASGDVSMAVAEEVPPAKTPADPEAAWRQTRLAITAGLVVLLLVVWIWQRKAGR